MIIYIYSSFFVRGECLTADLSIGFNTVSREILMSSSYAQENSTLMVLSRVTTFPVLFTLSIHTVFLYIMCVPFDWTHKYTHKNTHKVTVNLITFPQNITYSAKQTAH